MRRLAALGSGLLFGVGLILAGMTDPAKVRGFLDFAGAWDPTLAFVMAGAIGVHAPLLYVIRRRERPLFASSFDIPSANRVDGRLIAGASIFGAGWGLAGICPGPAIVSLGLGLPTALVFVVGMVIGIWAQAAWDRRVAAWRVSPG